MGKGSRIRSERQGDLEGIGNALLELTNSAAVVGGAVNRLELVAFSAVKLLIDRGVFTLEELEGAFADMRASGDLLEFWGRSPQAVPENAGPGDEAAQGPH